MEESKSMKIRRALRTAEAAVLFAGAFVELMLLMLGKDVHPIVAILICGIIAALCFFSRRSVGCFLSKLEKVTSRDLISGLLKLSVLVAVILFADPLREFLADYRWITSAVVLSSVLQFAGLCVAYYSGQGLKN